ncbi:hypothetical protein Aph02nite_20810 [Actinoplanes philippinensis]|uniref:Uncharacterized protein n=1 Tax=Actinoplanes philippinensis TaxID=35752 RepID=A0A1I2BUX3_9ACTN|nr:hypothetical protein [Actinoplanes philippinensis]GIE76131.1 hypothetical protein Aph02nite_20810 [Actinoplanes philippinensis]SFE59946.1 hypothetical protein SAMN05421541_102545 [Actinoplanes philippinensis]
MPTQDELRAALNDLAVGVDPLPAADLLRRARRRRARIRLAAMSGAAVAVAGIFLLVAPGRPQPPVVPPTVSLPSAGPSASASPTRLAREQRFVFGPETETDTGIFTTVITDTVTPPGPEKQTPAESYLDRIPGETSLPAINGDDRAVREIVIAGTPVRVFSEPAGGGTRREFQWISDGALHLLRSEPAMTYQGVVYGPTEADLHWLVERSISR